MALVALTNAAPAPASSPAPDATPDVTRVTNPQPDSLNYYLSCDSLYHDCVWRYDTYCLQNGDKHTLSTWCEAHCTCEQSCNLRACWKVADDGDTDVGASVDGGPANGEESAATGSD